MADQPSKDEKTEEATPRRRQEARERGQVAFSTELLASIMLFGAFGAVLLLGGSLMRGLGRQAAESLTAMGATATNEIDVIVAAGLMNEAGRATLVSISIFAVPLLAIGLLAGYGQVGFSIAPKALAWKLSRLSPAKGLERMFSARTVVRTGLALLKIAVIAATMGIVASLQVPNISGMTGISVGPTLEGTGHVVLRASTAALIVVLALGLVDFFFQRNQHEKDLRMSKQEAKEEHKHSEGDPHIKARIRQVQREMASRRMMSEVPDATVVVTNPTHYAVALRYERDSEDGRAPHIVAKGVDHVARKIKEVARENEVILFENVPLARALHAEVEIGEDIPEKFFEAVASVLAYVYRVRGEALAVA